MAGLQQRMLEGKERVYDMGAAHLDRKNQEKALRIITKDKGA